MPGGCDLGARLRVYACGAGCPAAPPRSSPRRARPTAPATCSGGSQARTAIYIHRDATDTLELVARTGDAAPGLPGNVFKALRQPAMSGLGKVAFSGKVRGSVKPRNRSGIFVYE